MDTTGAPRHHKRGELIFYTDDKPCGTASTSLGRAGGYGSGSRHAVSLSSYPTPAGQHF